MSGDLGPRSVIAATERFLDLHTDVELTLVGDQHVLTPLLARSTKLVSRFRLIHAPDIVQMTDDPVLALRHKKQSSMWAALESLQCGEVDACISAGNTGALLAIAKYLVKTFPGIDRPAICKSVPVESGLTYLLDLGANINCNATHLTQFALMGSALAEVMSVESPRVALLNIGSESQKGTAVLQAAHLLLESEKRLNYVGFVEASDIFTGNNHVVVCDGFHGNIALKSSEGAAKYISKKLNSTLQRNTLNRLLSFFAAPILKQLQKELNPALYNGASFLGLQKIVVKSHGNADPEAFMHALVVAREQVVAKLVDRISEKLTSI